MLRRAHLLRAHPRRDTQTHDRTPRETKPTVLSDSEYRYTGLQPLLRISGSTLDRAMLSAWVAVLACLCLARSSPPEPHPLRLHTLNSHDNKDINIVLATIEERLRVLDTISAVQVKQARRLEVIQDKLDRVETTLSLRLERAQLAAERLEHRLHMLQTSVQASIKESSHRIEESQLKITDLAQNLTNHIEGHRRLLEKVNGAYGDTWRRGLVLENMMRDGLSLVNATRRELADGLRALARRQQSRLTSADLEAAFARRLNDNTYRIDLKMQELLDAQKRFGDSCQRVQLDDPRHVADVLDRLIDSLINKTQATFHELQNIQLTMRNHDNKVMKMLNTARPAQNEATCRRLEGAFKNMSHTTFKESELHQLTEKFVALTDRADAALQKLEAKITDDSEDTQASDVTGAAGRLLLKLRGIKSEHDSDEDLEWEEEQDSGYYHDGGEGMMQEDREILTGARHGRPASPARAPHRRHLHKHPYDRGPKKKTN